MAVEEKKYERKVNEILAKREEARTERLLIRKERFDSSNLGMLVIQLTGLVSQLSSYVQEEYF
jgi:hypothetical protein